MIKRIWSWLAAWLSDHWYIAVLLALAIGLYVFLSIDGWVASWRTRRQDQQIQKQIDASAEQAGQHQENADTAGADRQTKEGRAARALEEKDQAAINSNRTIAPLQKARQRYEETRRTSPADSPALSDDQLCAELAKRNIPCR